MEERQLREKIIEIIGYGMERERAECKTDEIFALIKGQESRLKEIMPTDADIHFAGMYHYDYRIVEDGELKEKIIRYANIWREGAKFMRDHPEQFKIKTK